MEFDLWVTLIEFLVVLIIAGIIVYFRRKK